MNLDLIIIASFVIKLGNKKAKGLKSTIFKNNLFFIAL